MNPDPLSDGVRSTGVCLAAALLLAASSCSPSTPPIPPSVASTAIDGWLPTRTVDTHIAELRRKLEDDPSAPKHIVTVPRVGYRLQRD